METSFSINEMSDIFWPQPFECMNQPDLRKETFTRTFRPLTSATSDPLGAMIENAVYVAEGGIEMQVMEGEAEVVMTATEESFTLRQGDFIMLSTQGLLVFKCENQCTVMLTMAVSVS